MVERQAEALSLKMLHIDNAFAGAATNSRKSSIVVFRMKSSDLSRSYHQGRPNKNPTRANPVHMSEPTRDVWVQLPDIPETCVKKIFNEQLYIATFFIANWFFCVNLRPPLWQVCMTAVGIPLSCLCTTFRRKHPSLEFHFTGFEPVSLLGVTEGGNIPSVATVFTTGLYCPDIPATWPIQLLHI